MLMTIFVKKIVYFHLFSLYSRRMTENFEQKYLKVDDIHTVAYRLYGNKSGIPLLMFHGGPGGDIDYGLLELIDLNAFHTQIVKVLSGIFHGQDQNGPVLFHGTGDHLRPLYLEGRDQQAVAFGILRPQGDGQLSLIGGVVPIFGIVTVGVPVHRQRFYRPVNTRTRGIIRETFIELEHRGPVLRLIRAFFVRDDVVVRRCRHLD